jgi:uncharacterized DUF497 family protein
MTVLSDALEVTIPDPGIRAGNCDSVSIGLSDAGRLLVVAYTGRDQRIRVISAREAAPKERRQYESRG